jgi:hypothetical protein
VSELAEMKPVAEQTYRSIGRFIFEFSQLEYTVRHYLGDRSSVSRYSATISAQVILTVKGPQIRKPVAATAPACESRARSGSRTSGSAN